MDNRLLFVCWFSKNMSSNRRKALKMLLKSCKIDVTLITLKNFYHYENIELPIHRGFDFLTDVHKSDYARAYLMYFYGGGYSDIKSNSFDWNPYFDELSSSNYDAIGYSEKILKMLQSFGETISVQKILLQKDTQSFLVTATSYSNREPSLHMIG